MVKSLNTPALQRDRVSDGAGPFHGFFRANQFDLFETVSDEEGDDFAVVRPQSLRRLHGPFVQKPPPGPA